MAAGVLYSAVMSASEPGDCPARGPAASPPHNCRHQEHICCHQEYRATVPPFFVRPPLSLHVEQENSLPQNLRHDPTPKKVTAGHFFHFREAGPSPGRSRLACVGRARRGGAAAPADRE